MVYNYTTKAARRTKVVVATEHRIVDSHVSAFEPCHEIMALFVIRKLILQMRMRSHPEELDV